MGNVPFNKIESPLLAKAKALGVIVKRNFFADNIAPGSIELFGRYKSMTLTLKRWDQANKRVDPTQTETIKANLLIVATGRAAANDRLVTQVLGFSYSNLEPVNYMVLGIFNRGSSNSAGSDSESEAEDSEYEKALKVSQQIAQGGICFQTAEYDYLLANLCSLPYRCTDRPLSMPGEHWKDLLRGPDSSEGSQAQFLNIRAACSNQALLDQLTPPYIARRRLILLSQRSAKAGKRYQLARQAPSIRRPILFSL